MYTTIMEMSIVFLVVGIV